MRTIARYGWKPDVPDFRDERHRYAVPKRLAQALPPAVDLRAGCPPIYDQGQLGSCTGNGIAACLAFCEIKQATEAPLEVSRLFIYYNERVIEGTVDQDAGAEIRDGLKSVASSGACLEVAWPYDISKFAVKPDDVAYFDGLQRRAVKYMPVTQSPLALKSCLAEGFPVVFGFTVYESFESNEVARTGVVPMPSRNESVVGGHCVVLVGYSDDKDAYVVRNSWGEGWGQTGYCLMPYPYVHDSGLSSDFWTIRSVAQP